jgi:hypothetical protein
MAVRAFVASDPEHFDLPSLAGELLTNPTRRSSRTYYWSCLLLVISLSSSLDVWRSRWASMTAIER